MERKKALSRLFFTSFVSRPFEKKRNFYRDKRKESLDEKFSSSYFLIFVVLKQWRGCKTFYLLHLTFGATEIINQI